MLCIVTVSNNVIIACIHIQPKGVEEAFIQGLNFRLWAEVETVSRGFTADTKDTARQNGDI